MEAQEFFQTTFCPQFPSDNMTSTNVNAASAADHFLVEDFFDFSNDDATITDATIDNSVPTDDVSPVDSTSNSSSGHPNFLPDIADTHFSSDLSVPVHTCL